jgi:hypothetical protein
VIVPIFDGYKALSPSIKEWLLNNFPGLLDGLDETDSEPGKLDVRISCSKWWYYSDDLMPEEEEEVEETGTDNGDEEHKRSSEGGPGGGRHSTAGGVTGTKRRISKDAYDVTRTSIPDDEVLRRLAMNTKHYREGSYLHSFSAAMSGTVALSVSLCLSLSLL